MKMITKLATFISFSVGFILSLLILFLIFATVLDYRPPEKRTIEMVKTSKQNSTIDRETSLISWNIGYAGLGKEMDFFYEGGKQVRPSRQMNASYLNSILEFLSHKQDVDFILLQEVDKKSKRSYHTNQVLKISNTVPNHTFSFAKNYDVSFVPVPTANPMGKVKSGLMTLSLTNPKSSERVSFPGNYAWPKSLFLLDRCFLVQRFKTSIEKELVLVNTHNSAFDDGQLREKQMEVLRAFAIAEYQNGNHVIVGGDWNQNPPVYKPEEVVNGDHAVKNDLGNIPPDFMPDGWSWSFDKTTSTNRFVDEVYVKGETPTTIIDYFLISPNIEVMSVSTMDLNFAFTDHNPVELKIRLKD